MENISWAISLSAIAAFLETMTARHLKFGSGHLRSIGRRLSTSLLALNALPLMGSEADWVNINSGGMGSDAHHE